MIREILIWPHPMLQTTCEEVKEITPDIKRLLEDMAETMLNAKGAGLAAPQVGFALRLITVLVQHKGKMELLKLVNPKLTEVNGIKVPMREGCLSLPGHFDRVDRFPEIKVEALDENGEKVDIEADGILAHALQHELEHLEGRVFVDYLSPLKRSLVKVKFQKLKKKGIRYKAEHPDGRDFTEPSTPESPSRLEAMLAAMNKEIALETAAAADQTAGTC